MQLQKAFRLSAPQACVVRNCYYWLFARYRFGLLTAVVTGREFMELRALHDQLETTSH